MRLYELYDSDELLEASFGFSANAMSLFAISQDMLVFLQQQNHKLSEGLKAENPFMGSMLAISRFVQENYYNKFQNLAANFLRDAGHDYEKKYRKSIMFNNLGSSKVKNSKGSKVGDMFEGMANFYITTVPDILKHVKNQKLPDDIKQQLVSVVPNIMGDRVDEFFDLLTQTRKMNTAIKAGDFETGSLDKNVKVDPNAMDPASIALRKQQAEKAERERDLSGGQRNQAEQLVNQVLQNLPDKKVAAEIRQEIAKAGNKIQALQLALQKHGIKL